MFEKKGGCGRHRKKKTKCVQGKRKKKRLKKSWGKPTNRVWAKKQGGNAHGNEKRREKPRVTHVGKKKEMLHPTGGEGIKRVWVGSTQKKKEWGFSKQKGKGEKGIKARKRERKS